MYAQSSVAVGMNGASKAMAAVNKQMAPAKQAKIIHEFQKQSAQLDMTTEMMSDAIDDALDDDEAEEETEDLTNQVLDEIGVDVASQLSAAPRGKIASKQTEDASRVFYLAVLRLTSLRSGLQLYEIHDLKSSESSSSGNARAQLDHSYLLLLPQIFALCAGHRSLVGEPERASMTLLCQPPSKRRKGYASKGGTSPPQTAIRNSWEQGCYSSDILAAMDVAIRDVVDVLSFFVSSGFPIPLNDDGIAIGSFRAMEHGISVVCAAGNNGPII
ncbi:hypothetical protein SAY86_001190 [Trapa natans]|uniref:Subtilisin n=1 Tax=Trapa natans TaxID=22666 RepID=A0AAN7MQK7_TRANT|nr:hypothetical protein SAY86_001190 [Trapa natans]